MYLKFISINNFIFLMIQRSFLTLHSLIHHISQQLESLCFALNRFCLLLLRLNCTTKWVPSIIPRESSMVWIRHYSLSLLDGMLLLLCHLLFLKLYLMFEHFIFLCHVLSCFLMQVILLAKIEY